ncbi:SufS subfamily cysteine desulfurase [Oceanococcus atlanticus]|uniref:Probable cysteine desulfurase n=1 Tax=Oceanococcus atlanticus TaxID=1317117 RepID=A0A1Y1SFH6_9GAMM|nr:cysteine desulfurase [Oceanococcus atlanticus]ORE88386.1 SufS subfamily cysteine desulfurase [Oceanococcus atlanticus]
MTNMIDALRARFPALQQQVNGQPLAYLDNAATTQKPDTVIQALLDYYRQDNANVHRAVHTLAGRATRDYEGARDRIAQFINAASRENVIFTRGTTEAINLVAYSWARHQLGEGDEILITELEHHSNIVPWQLICKETGAVLKAAPVKDSGELDMAALQGLLSSRTKLVAIGDASNAIGTINPVAEIITLAHKVGARVLVDAAQAMAHHSLDVQALDADFVAFSAHKMYGPTGFGVLYGKTEVLEQAQPWQGGGDMIETVTLEESTWNALPYRFEAGTPNIADAIATGAAVDFMQSLDLNAVAEHEQRLLQQATEGLNAVDGLRIIGTAPKKAAIVSFVMDTAHPQDIGTLLDENGIAVRTGHHCAMPLMARFDVPGTVRASFAAYNTAEEVERLIDSVHRIARLFA